MRGVPGGEKIPAAVSVVFGALAAGLLGEWRWHFFTMLGMAGLFYRQGFDKKSLDNIFKQSGLTKKNGEFEDTPKLIAKKETDDGFQAVLSLPVGLSSRDFIRRSQTISEALNAEVDFKYENGKIIMTADKTKLKTFYSYEPRELPGAVEIPIGHSKSGFVTLNFSDEYSSMLVAGASGYGKTAFLRQALVSLITSGKDIRLHLVDLKFGAEFGTFRKCRIVEDFATEEDEVSGLTRKLEKMVRDRYREFESRDVVKISNYNKKFDPMLYHLVVIDEFASLNQRPDILNRLIYLARLSRAAGIYFIFATQYPTTEAIPSALKFNCQVRLAFKVKMAINSRVILDYDGAEDLPCPGRAILSTNQDQIVQVPFLDEDEAKRLVLPFAEKRKIKEKGELKRDTTPDRRGVMSLEAYERAVKSNHKFHK
jgi:S-DNA-T family DNA segregation ATPase FtsK/SpoIIIE